MATTLARQTNRTEPSNITLSYNKEEYVTLEEFSLSPQIVVSLAPVPQSPLREHSPLQEGEPTTSPIVDKRRYFAPEPLDNERKRKRRLTSARIDDVNINCNILLPLVSLLCFIENNLLC